MSSSSRLVLFSSSSQKLEGRAGKPPKNPTNSSLPPSSGQKANVEDKSGRKKVCRRGRPGVARELCPNPDVTRNRQFGGWTVCRFHGAWGGAPTGQANGAWKHGHFSGEAKAFRPECAAGTERWPRFGGSRGWSFRAGSPLKVAIA